MPEPRASNAKWEDWSQEVLKQLMALNNKTENLTKEQADLRDDLKQLNESFSKKTEVLNTILSGNGDPSKGLILRVALLEEAKKNFDEYIEEEKETRKWITRSTIAACLTAIGSLGVTIVKLILSKG
jgi:ABC-type transporter Mla subunit MlaD